MKIHDSKPVEKDAAATALSGMLKFYTLELALDPTTGDINGVGSYHGVVLKEAGVDEDAASRCEAAAQIFSTAAPQLIDTAEALWEIHEALHKLQASETKGENASDSSNSKQADNDTNGDQIGIGGSLRLKRHGTIIH